MNAEAQQAVRGVRRWRENYYGHEVLGPVEDDALPGCRQRGLFHAIVAVEEDFLYFQGKTAPLLPLAGLAKTCLQELRIKLPAFLGSPGLDAGRIAEVDKLVRPLRSLPVYKIERAPLLGRLRIGALIQTFPAQGSNRPGPLLIDFHQRFRLEPAQEPM